MDLSRKKAIERWLNDLNNFSFRDFNNLPELDLYMEQVMKYLDKQLYIFQTSTDDKQITPSMINNYVKGEVIPAPKAKKYSKEHLAIIQEVCSLKKVLSLDEIKQIIQTTYNNENKELIYDHFNMINTSKTANIVSDAFKALNDVDDNDELELTNIALEFAITANCYINIAKRILYYNRAFKLSEELKNNNEDNNNNYDNE